MKDAQGHGSNTRGGAVKNYAAVMARNPGYNNLRAKLDAFNRVHLDDRQAAMALANGHPKADKVAAHGAFKVQELALKRAGTPWATKKAYGRRATAEKVAQNLRVDGGYTRVKVK